MGGVLVVLSVPVIIGVYDWAFNAALEKEHKDADEKGKDENKRGEK